MSAWGNNGTVLKSVNGIIWERKQITAQNLNKVIYHGSTYVIVGSNGTVLRGTSYTNIAEVTNNLTTEIISIQYDELYVAIDVNGDIFYSSDLEFWNKKEINVFGSDVPKDLLFVPEYGNDGRYIVVGSGSTIMFSDQEINRATAETSQTNGIVTSISITNGGFGYSQDNPPSVLIESPIIKREKLSSIKAKGDFFGTIIGINTFSSGTTGIGTTTPKIDFVLKSENYDNSNLGIGYSSLNTFGISASQLEKGDFFIIHGSNVSIGAALTGITTFSGLNGTSFKIIQILRMCTATSFIDGVYRVESVTTANSGIVTVTCNFAPNDYNVAGGTSLKVYRRGADVSGVNTNQFYGYYSWGKIYDFRNRIFGKSTRVYR